MASLGLWTLPFCSLARIFPTFCSVASLPIELTPLFSSDGISTEWVLFPLQRRPLQQRDGRGLLLVAAWHMDGNLELRAEDAAPRSLAPRESGRPNRVRTRREVRLVGPALCRLKHNPAEEPTQASTTRHVRSESRQLVVHLPASCSAPDWHRSACSQSMSRYRLSTFFFAASDRLGIMP